MLTSVRDYLSELTQFIGDGWNQFWFAEDSGSNLACLRQITGVFAFFWLLSFSGELTAMFGPDGWLSRSSVQQIMTDGDPTQRVPGFSHLFLIQSPTLLWATHLASLACLLLVAIGRWHRVTTPMGLLVVLSYIHRAPMLTQPFETVLCMLLLTLSVGPAYSLWHWKSHTESIVPDWTANLVARLIQVHLCGIYLMIATTKIATPAWMVGDGIWYLITDAQHRLIDVTPWLTSNMTLNALTHAWLLFELAFPVLIWVRKLRPLLITISSVIWIVAALLSGQVGYSLLMLTANLAFVSSGSIEGLLRRMLGNATSNSSR